MGTKVIWNKEPKPKEKKIYQLKRTKLNPIGKKKRKRLENGGSELQMFWEIWNSMLIRQCCVCGKIIDNFAVWCFAHILSKKMYPNCRLIKENIALVCDYKCHQELDKQRDLYKKRTFYLELCEKYPDILQVNNNNVSD